MKLKKIVIILTLGISIFLGTSFSASADTGDFYDKYKSEFTNVMYSPAFIKVLEVYDLESNSFDCGKFNVYCHMQSLQYTTTIGLLNFVVTGLEYIVVTNDWFLKEPTFIKYKGYFDSMTTTLLALFLVWQIMAGYAKRFTDLDDTSELINEKFLKVVVGGAFLGMYDLIFKMIIDIQNSMLSGIMSFAVDKESFALVAFKYGPKYSILIVVFIVIILFIFLIALSYRFIAFSFMFIVGPLAITTILNEEFNYFTLWFKYIINNVVTLTLQSIAFVLAIGSVTIQFSFLKSLPTGVEIVMGIILALGYCIFALVIPMILGNLGGSSGTGRTIGKMVRLAVMKR